MYQHIFQKNQKNALNTAKYVTDATKVIMSISLNKISMFFGALIDKTIPFASLWDLQYYEYEFFERLLTV
jgi:hypothetical protein